MPGVSDERESLEAEVDAKASYELARDRAVERHAPTED